MDPTYVNVMDTSDLAYVMLIYALHGGIILAHAGLAGFLFAKGSRELLRRNPNASPGWGALYVVLGLMLLAPLLARAPVWVSIAAAVIAFFVLAFRERGAQAGPTRIARAMQRSAVAFAAISAVFMLWEREDNLSLGADLLLRTIEFRNEELMWQQSHDPQSPKVGDMAPDFELQDPEGKARVRLSDFRGERPVALVFGSYT